MAESIGPERVAELVKRLRAADEGSTQRVLGSRIFAEAADALAALAAENARLAYIARAVEESFIAADFEWGLPEVPVLVFAMKPDGFITGSMTAEEIAAVLEPQPEAAAALNARRGRP